MGFNVSVCHNVNFNSVECGLMHKQGIKKIADYTMTR